ncbi:MAG: CopG family transcriptional regulator [Bacillota bacterium]|nr:CopG family transcriptional regulator [Bacillota bacterium]
MEYQNITLSIPKEILKKIKHIAVEKDTSISKMLTSTLEEIVSREEGYQQARERQLKLMEEGFDMGLYGKATWKRNELYDR